MMNENEKLALLEDIFEMDENSLTADMSLEDIEEYDSITKLSLIVAIEDEFGKKITGEVIKNFKTVQDILDVMN